jgi:hypothetical protein
MEIATIKKYSHRLKWQFARPSRSKLASHPNVKYFHIRLQL